MAFDYINEAFKRLSVLDEEMFNTSLDGINKLDNFMDQDIEPVVSVIDPEAETEEDFETSYVGKVITNCNVCHSHIFNNKEDIVIDPEDGSVNTEVTCPYCGESEGFTIIGEIAPFAAATEDQPEEETPAEEQPVDGTEPVEEPLEEGLGIGAGLALGGAAIGAGMVGSKLLDDVNKDEDEEVLEEGVIGDINVNLDSSGAAVGFLGGTATATNEDVEEEEEKMSRASKRCMQEDFKEVSITTEDQHMEMTSDENGKVTVTTEPIQTETPVEEETIVPVSDETEEEILSSNDIEEEPVEDEFDFDFEDVDEEGFDELGEGYLKNVYENVNSFKTTDVYTTPSTLILEGIIEFTSGAKKKTGFMFEAKDANLKGQVRFTGSNKQLCESADAFSLVGRVDNKKLFVESLKYNYSVNESVVRGRIRRK